MILYNRNTTLNGYSLLVMEVEKKIEHVMSQDIIRKMVNKEKTIFEISEFIGISVTDIHKLLN